MVCTCENLSDWAGAAGRTLGGSIGRSAYQHVQTELLEAWTSLTAQVARNEHVGAVSIRAVFDLVEVFLERRYKRYATVLPAGRLREEVLANVARQIDELRDDFAAFNDSLTDRCRRVDYSDQARFAGERYLALLGPAVAALLYGDDGPSSAPSRAAPGGGAAAVTPSPARRSIMKSVVFEPTPPATPSAPPAQPAAASPALAPPPAAGWPPFSAGPSPRPTFPAAPRSPSAAPAVPSLRPRTGPPHGVATPALPRARLTRLGHWLWALRPARTRRRSRRSLVPELMGRSLIWASRSTCTSQEPTAPRFP
jgi:hypothetical protein